MRSLVLLIVLISACDNTPREAPIPRTPMVTLAGRLRLSGDATKLPEIGGDVHLFVYARNDEGYCIRRDALFAQVTQLVRTPSKQQLIDGIDYEVRFEEPPGQTYDVPIPLYVTAVWQNTRSRAHDCEVDALSGGPPIVNALGAYGVAFDAPAASACCGVAPTALELRGADTRFDGVDVVISARSTAECVDPLARADGCFFRRAMNGSDSACSVALGAQRDEVLRDRDGNVCP